MHYLNYKILSINFLLWFIGWLKQLQGPGRDLQKKDQDVPLVIGASVLQD